jgi:hypothetical protein
MSSRFTELSRKNSIVMIILIRYGPHPFRWRKIWAIAFASLLDFLLVTEDSKLGLELVLESERVNKFGSKSV